VAWTTTGREGQIASVLRAGDTLMLLKAEGELIVARAAPKAFEPLAKYQLADAMTWSTPAITDRFLLVRHDSDISAWSFR
jgi:hypothetical protein